MKLQWELWVRAAKWIGIGLTAMASSWIACAQAVDTTSVNGTVYLANGAPGSGSLQLSWPAFTTADNHAITAGHTSVTIGQNGSVSVNLAPNLGSTPAGLYYTAVYHMSDGTTSTEYWVVPPGEQARIAQVRAQVMPAVQAVQAVSKAYVDQAIQSINQGALTSTGGALTGPLYLNGDPSLALQAADKHYVDAAFAQSLPLTGGTLSGPLSLQSNGKVVASLSGPASITLPGLSATNGHNCLQIDGSGYMSNTGLPCSSGTVNSGNSGEIAYYSGSGTAITGISAVPVTAGGTGAATAGAAIANLGGMPLTGGTLTGPVAFSGAGTAVTTLANLGGAQVSVKAYGAVGNDSSANSVSNFTAFQACINDAQASGSMTCYVPNGRYHLSEELEIHGSMKLVCQSANAVLVADHTVQNTNPNWDSSGWDTIVVDSQAALSFPIAGAFTAGQTQFTPSSVTGLSVGQEVFMWLGQDPYDPGQHYLAQFNRIIGIAGNVVTLAKPLPEAVAAPTNHTSTLNTLSSIAENVEISGCGFDYVGTADVGIQTTVTRNVYIHDIVGHRVNHLLLGIDNSEGVVIDNIHAKVAGGLLSGWGSHDVIARNLICDDCAGPLIELESQNRGWHFENLSWSSSTMAAGASLSIHGNSINNSLKGYSYNAQHTNQPLYLADTSELDMEDVLLGANVGWYDMHYHHGKIGWNGKIYSETKQVTIVQPLLSNTGATGGAGFNLPSGIYKSVSVYVSSNIGLTGIGAFYFFNGSSQGQDIAPILVGGQTVDLHNGRSMLLSLDAGEFNGGNLQGRHVSYFTDATMPAGQTVVITIEYYPDPTDLYVNPNTLSTGPLHLGDATSPIYLNGDAGITGKYLTSAGQGATPTWSAGVSLSGTNTWTGSNLFTNPVVLPSDPTSNLQAATKHYVDALFPGVTPDGSNGLNVTGAVSAAGFTIPNGAALGSFSSSHLSCSLVDLYTDDHLYIGANGCGQNNLVLRNGGGWSVTMPNILGVGTAGVVCIDAAGTLSACSSSALRGTTSSIGSSALAAGQCASGTVSIAGVTNSMAVVATPATYPGDAFDWKAYVSATGIATVKVCTNLAAGGTPAASVYNVRVIQ